MYNALNFRTSHYEHNRDLNTFRQGVFRILHKLIFFRPQHSIITPYLRKNMFDK